MAQFNIADFNNQYDGDYARPNIFEVDISNVGNGARGGTKMMVKAASIPAASITPVEVPYQNRKLKVPGDRTFVDWTATVINDESYQVRADLLAWQAQMAGFQDFKSTIGVGTAHRLITVTPYDRDGGSTSGFEHLLYGWPSEVGAIDLSWETTDAIQEYTVTFAISWDNGGVGGEIDKLTN